MRKLLLDSVLDIRNYPNQKTHESESACLLVWALPEFQNHGKKQFSHQVLYNF